MLAAYEIRPALIADAMFIASHARQADIDELWAAAHASPLSSMLRGMHNSEAVTCLFDGIPVCMYGVAAQSLLLGVGVPWMVGTDAIDRHAMSFLRGSRAAVHGMLSKWSHLHNFVDARNVKAIRWLKFLGFKIHPAVPHGEQGLPFHYFEMRS